ncbi:hypothetical protein RclHR1_00740032 [Rhizophagus clarus]|nr:hypothetical protein RclHR1_00740032 [Rhizophagus clarus]
MLIQGQNELIQRQNELIQRQNNTNQTLIQRQNDTSQAFIEAIRQLIGRQEKKRTISLSSMKRSDLHALLNSFRIIIDAVNIDVSNMNLTRNASFRNKWDDGFSDCKETFATGRTLVHEIQVGFELKKSVEDSHVPQAIGQLLAANIISIEAVIIVLTDLNDEWIFFWLDYQDNIYKVKQFTVSLKDAIFIIEKAFTHDVKLPFKNFRNYQEYVRAGGTRIATIESDVILESKSHELQLFLDRPKVSIEFEI